MQRGAAYWFPETKNYKRALATRSTASLRWFDPCAAHRCLVHGFHNSYPRRGVICGDQRQPRDARDCVEPHIERGLLTAGELAPGLEGVRASNFAAAEVELTLDDGSMAFGARDAESEWVFTIHPTACDNTGDTTLEVNKAASALVHGAEPAGNRP